MEKARKSILASNGQVAPRILDPFAGGGAIPLEALRLGCETYASDYNPVSTLILKCTLDYPQRFGDKSREHGLESEKGKSRFLERLEKWGSWVLEEAKREVIQFYPEDKDGSVAIGYIWARTIPCQNPSCNSRIPLMRQYWLSKKTDKKVSLYPSVSQNEVTFRIVGTGYEKPPKDFDPDKGTVSRAVARCLVCGSIVAASTTRDLFVGGRSGERMVAVVLHSERAGKIYRIANGADLQVFNETESFLERKRAVLSREWGIEPLPDEDFPKTARMITEPLGSAQNYHFKTWGDLFSSRQKLTLITFADKLRQAYGRMISDGMSEDYAKAISTLLALRFDMMAVSCNTLCRWESTRQLIADVYARQVLQMTWDYVESNPFSGSSGSWEKVADYAHRYVEHAAQTGGPAEVLQSSATELPYADNFFDAVCTDPPYYDNVPYSYLSDFFYVWLKRTIGSLYPDLFSTPLTPKSDEVVAYSRIEKGVETGKAFFETLLRKSFTEINRVLKPNGISIIVYAHKSTAGWETLVNSLSDSGLVVTGAWPIHTEMRDRLTAMESAALASSIYIVARKLKREQTGFYKEVKEELMIHVRDRLNKLWNEGISGADFFISAIGSSMEIFGKYGRILDDEGNVIRASRLLEDIRKIATDYAVKQVLHNGIAGEITAMTRFYVLWRWAYGESKLEFDDADKLAKGVGINLPYEWNKGFIKKEKEFIEILGPDERGPDEFTSSKELIDVLHHVLTLWKKGNGDEILKVLQETGFGRSDVFYRVAQAISESLPNGSREKKLLEGFLQGRQRIAEDIREQSEQKRLFE